MQFPLKYVVYFMIGLVVLLALGAITTSQFGGFEEAFAELVGE
jgi:hypothetical protein